MHTEERKKYIFTTFIGIICMLGLMYAYDLRNKCQMAVSQNTYVYAGIRLIANWMKNVSTLFN